MKKVKKLAWWLQFTDGSIKKVFAANAAEAFQRGTKMGTPISVSGSKAVAESGHTPLYSSKENMKAADPERLIELLKFISTAQMDDQALLVQDMQKAAAEALCIVENFPKIII